MNRTLTDSTLDLGLKCRIQFVPMHKLRLTEKPLDKRSIEVRIVFANAEPAQGDCRWTSDHSH